MASHAASFHRQQGIAPQQQRKNLLLESQFQKQLLIVQLRRYAQQQQNDRQQQGQQRQQRDWGDKIPSSLETFDSGIESSSNDDDESSTQSSTASTTLIGGATVCCICFDVPKPYHLSMIDSGCSHLFCYDCIEKWSKTNPSCPLCKKNFSNISRVCYNEHDHCSSSSFGVLIEEEREREQRSSVPHWGFCSDSGSESSSVSSSEESPSLSRNQITVTARPGDTGMVLVDSRVPDRSSDGTPSGSSLVDAAVVAGVREDWAHLIRPGDYIVSIDGRDVFGKTSTQIMSIMDDKIDFWRTLVIQQKEGGASPFNAAVDSATQPTTLRIVDQLDYQAAPQSESQQFHQRGNRGVETERQQQQHQEAPGSDWFRPPERQNWRIAQRLEQRRLRAEMSRQYIGSQAAAAAAAAAAPHKRERNSRERQRLQEQMRLYATRRK